MPSRKLHIQLYVDECFPVPSATFLKSLGYSVIHAYDRNLVQKSDRVHLSESRKSNRVLITIDRDFLYYNEVNLDSHPGVIVISAGSVIPTHINKICQRFLQNISEDFVKNSLLRVSKDKIIKMKKGVVVSEKIM